MFTGKKTKQRMVQLKESSVLVLRNAHNTHFRVCGSHGPHRVKLWRQKGRFIIGVQQKGLKMASSSLFCVVLWELSQHQMCGEKEGKKRSKQAKRTLVDILVPWKQLN